MRDNTGKLLPGSNELNGRTGELSNRWKGEKASYAAKHMWIKKHYGSANKCENPECKCKNPKRFEWANISGLYHRERSDYIMLCPSCHRKIDKGNFCKYGHEFTPENTIIRKEGWRICRICTNTRARNYNLKNKT